MDDFGQEPCKAVMGPKQAEKCAQFSSVQVYCLRFCLSKVLITHVYFFASVQLAIAPCMLPLPFFHKAVRR